MLKAFKYDSANFTDVLNYEEVEDREWFFGECGGSFGIIVGEDLHNAIDEMITDVFNPSHNVIEGSEDALKKFRDNFERLKLRKILYYLTPPKVDSVDYDRIQKTFCIEEIPLPITKGNYIIGSYYE